MNNFYCAAIHHNIRVDATVDSQIKISPCCAYNTSNCYSTLDHYYSSTEIQQLKTATEWPNGCQVCHTQESQGQVSFRNHSNAALKNISGTRYELMPSNICNLKCVMCYPASSTALAKERHTIGIEPMDLSRENNISIKQLELLSQVNDIESISAIGGEFFLTKGNLEIMDFVIAKNIPFRAVTNATVILDSHLERLKQIADLELQISIDGYAQGYEIMRYPAKWSEFADNVHRLIKELPQAQINFHFVAQALNIQQLVPTLDWCNQQRRTTRITNLIFPDYLSWKIFTVQEKDQKIQLIKDQFTQYKITQSQQTFVSDLCDTMLAVQHDPDSRQLFESTIRKIYQHRWPALRESNSHHVVRSQVFYPLN